MSQSVEVTMLLSGGHRVGVRMDRADPLLAQVFGALQAKGRGETADFRLLVDEGTKTLAFSAHDLVAVVTDPPYAAAPAAAPAAPVEKARWLLIDDFLSPAQHRALLDLVARQANRFQDSSVSTGDAEHRRSKVLFSEPFVDELFRARIAEAAPRWIDALGIGRFPVGGIEVQVTAHGEGAYFKLHNDSGSPEAATRGLTWVYYFFNEPQAFSGGALRLYDSVIDRGQYRCGAAAGDVVPRDNSIVVFAPHIHHEVLPVTVPSNRFDDSRFTVNGWVRRAA